jgi:formate hydrogenlyase subunit 4
MMPWLALLLHAALVAVLAPTLDGVLRGHPSGSWRDLVRLSRKPSLQPVGASFIFSIAPSLSLAAAATAALLVPSFTLGMVTSPAADLIVVLALLALSRLALALATFEAGATNAFAGTRIADARVPIVPVLFLVALGTLMMAGNTNIEAAALRDGLPGLRLPALLTALALLAVVAHEPSSPAIVSGRDLALTTVAAQLRRLAGLSLVATTGLPFGIATPGATLDAWVVGAACWVLKLGILGTIVTILGPHRAILPAAALIALVAAIILGAQASV